MNSEDYYSGHWSLWLKVFLSPCVILILTRTSDHRSKCLCFQAEIVLHNFLGLSWTQSDEGKKSKFNLQNTADAIFFLNYKFKCIFPSSICLPWSVRIVSLVSWKEERENWYVCFTLVWSYDWSIMLIHFFLCLLPAQNTLKDSLSEFNHLLLCYPQLGGMMDQ